MTKKHRRMTAEAAVLNTNKTRRENLRALVGEGRRFPSQGELASALGVSDSYLSQLLGAEPSRRVTEVTARKFEYALKLRTGSLDVAG